RSGKAILQANALPQLSEAFRAGIALNLHKISLGHLEARVRDPRLRLAVVGQKQQPLAVEIETPGGIDPRQVYEVGKRGARSVAAELADHAIGLVEQDHPRHAPAPATPTLPGKERNPMPARMKVFFDGGCRPNPG